MDAYHCSNDACGVVNWGAQYYTSGDAMVVFDIGGAGSCHGLTFDLPSLLEEGLCSSKSLEPLVVKRGFALG